jgi:hypothetical protein
VEVWVDGRSYDMGAASDSIKGNWSLQVNQQRYTLMVGADRDTAVQLVVGSDTLSGRDVSHEGDRLVFTVQRGSEAPEAFDLRLRAEVLQGTLTSNAHPGKSHHVVGVRASDEKDRKKDKKPEPITTPVGDGQHRSLAHGASGAAFGAAGQERHVWTAGPQGILRGADLLIKGGKIAAVGKNLTRPPTRW